MRDSGKTLTASEVGKQWFDRVWAERDRSAIFEFLSPNAKGFLEGGQRTEGPEPFAAFHDAMLAAFPDPQFRSLSQVAQGDEVFVHWEFSGTHEGDGLEMPATGEKITFSGMTRFIVREGKIIEGWDCWNHGGVMTALGAADEVIRAM